MKLSVTFPSVYNASMCEMTVHKIINSILQSCTYILSKEECNKIYLIDCGDVGPIFQYLDETGKELEGIFLTHAHYDHVYGLKDLLNKYPTLKVYGNIITLDGLKFEDVTLSYLYEEGFKIVLNDNQSIPVYDNQKILVLGEEVYCMATPGHDVDCMTYVFGNYIFTGDSFNPHSEVFSKWSRSDVEMAKHNERRIKNIIQEKFMKVYPGHQIDYD